MKDGGHDERDTVRWVIIVVAALLVVGLLGWARGDEHHRGDDVGSLGFATTRVVSQPCWRGPDPMADPTTTEEPKPREGSDFPSAYTILFALIVLTAIATWFVPAGVYDVDKNGSPIPGTYHEVDSHPARILVDSLTAPINGLYGIENDKGNINYYNSGTLFGAIDVALVHHRHRRLPRRHHAAPARSRPASAAWWRDCEGVSAG